MVYISGLAMVTAGATTVLVVTAKPLTSQRLRIAKWASMIAIVGVGILTARD